MKEERVGETLMWEGSEFQRVGQQLRRPDHPKSVAQSVELVAGWQRWTGGIGRGCGDEIGRAHV